MRWAVRDAAIHEYCLSHRHSRLVDLLIAVVGQVDEMTSWSAVVSQRQQ